MKREEYFNPRPRKEGDKTIYRVQVGAYISIHALAKRATRGEKIMVKTKDISIHALAKRATIF